MDEQARQLAEGQPPTDGARIRGPDGRYLPGHSGNPGGKLKARPAKGAPPRSPNPGWFVKDDPRINRAGRRKAVKPRAAVLSAPPALYGLAFRLSDIDVDALRPEEEGGNASRAWERLAELHAEAAKAWEELKARDPQAARAVVLKELAGLEAKEAQPAP